MNKNNSYEVLSLCNAHKNNDTNLTTDSRDCVKIKLIRSFMMCRAKKYIFLNGLVNRLALTIEDRAEFQIQKMCYSKT